ncbi:unnamed protein product [Nezara viridula]|uniref:Cytochrome P450 n=1 Tax=Nezara viridula TaxID=85310 RepID=A0A9P0MX31_NEZVI|nr:unnamed protein product [Nezara viridula]
MEGIYLSSASYLLLFGLAILWAVLSVLKRPKGSAPGPTPLPVLGSLHLLGGYELPYQAFDKLSSKYGPVFGIRLGSVECLVVSSLETVKEILINKGEHFDSRPNFSRYLNIFGGDKDNSLAFCDWSELQKTRREMIRDHTFPKAFSSKFHQLESLLNRELVVLCDQLSKGVTNIKPIMLHTCANVFMSFFTNTRFQLEDPVYSKILMYFDIIFYEVNQGYAADFMPWLNPMLMNNMKKMRKLGKIIREFMDERVVSNGGQEGDLLHMLLESVESGKMNRENAMFALEDIIGGHTAIANLIIKILGFISNQPEVQKKMQEEVDAVTCGKNIKLEDRLMMPYTEAVILESIRHICSPIVPHVASQDTTVNDYHVEKGTLIFLNNYTLNMSPELWTEPEKFSPERFLTEDGRLIKPEHFLPFGGGRRSCMGYKMTQYVSFSVLATMMQKYSIAPHPTNGKVPRGDLALPFDTLKFIFNPR